MAKKLAPTRGNLVKLQRSIEQAKNGRDLLDQKRQVLMMEMVKYMSKAKDIQGEVASTFRDAYSALQQANVAIGIDNVEDIVGAIPKTEDIVVRLHSIMGVEIPDIDEIDVSIDPCFSILTESASIDEAYLAFRKVLSMLVALAEVETSVYRLAVQIRKTHRRVNALDKVVIPNDRAQITFINDVLEEGDREDFVRMKAAKSVRSSSEKS